MSRGNKRVKEQINVGILDSEIGFDRRGDLGCVVDAWKGDFSSYDDLTGHGTACALLIRRITPTARIFNLKIFDGATATSPGLVLDGIRWCIENDIDVINVSVAIPEIGYYHEFAELCKRAVERNIIIVAAADNMGRPCLPAYLDTVLGVGAASLEGDQFLYRPHHPIQLYADADAGGASSQHCFIGSRRGSSFATARMSGLVARVISALDEPRSVSRVTAELAKLASPFNSQQILTVNEEFDFEANAAPAVFRSELVDQVEQFGRTVLFGSLLDSRLFAEHQRHLRFPLVKVLTAPTGARIPLFPGTPQGAKEDEVVDAMAVADTLILGHVDQQCVDILSLLTRVRASGKNVFLLRTPVGALSNAICRSGEKDGGGWTRWPMLDERSLSAQLTAIPRTHIAKSQIPVLSVVHLGGQQLGRLNAELNIRDMLSQTGNRIMQIGSAPYSELFGCEFSYWSGCFSPSFPAGLRVAFSKLLVETLNHATPRAALLAIGTDQGPCPSSFLTRDFFTSYSEPALSFLFGVQPDGIVAVVDEMTDPQVARRNVEALQHLLGCDVLFVLHDSPLAAYASAIGRPAPLAAGVDSCQCCRPMRQALSVPVFCGVSAEFRDQGVNSMVKYFGLTRRQDVYRTQA